MSRVAKKPITIPNGVDVKFHGQVVSIKGSKGALDYQLNKDVEVKLQDGTLIVRAVDGVIGSNAQAGTARAQLAKIVSGVHEPNKRHLVLKGVGYRAQAQGKVLNLTLGFSHPVEFPIPEGIHIETPTQTDIIITGVNNHMVGQVAAKIRAFREPDPYKGKGIRYINEVIILKEAKKK